MKEISLNILDVAQNSLRANATEINILVFFDTAADRLTVSIKDNGCGIADVKKAMEPLFTTGGSERAGLGFAVMQSFMDKVKVISKPGKGTKVLLIKRLAQRE